MDQIQGMTKRTAKQDHDSPNFFKSINSGTITIHIENEPFLRLTLTQSNTDRIKLEFGQKFVGEALMIGLDRLFDTN
jgi:hypothetical protein